MIALSVHLITYNNEKHIEETLQSILKQKVDFNYEIVVGDDCSVDKTLEIINNYADLHPNIFKIKKNDIQLGILGNFKSTLDRCKGTYVFDIAGDDMLKGDNALQKMVSVLQSDPSLGFVYSGFDRLEDHNNKIISFKDKDVFNTSKEAFKEAVLFGKANPITLCYNKAHLYKYVDFDSYLKMELTIEDHPIFVDLVMQTNFARIRESLHVYRAHSNSHSHQKDFETLVFQKRQLKKLFDFFSNKYQFSGQITKKHLKNHYKELLFLAGYFQNKKLGKEIFSKINQKSSKDFIHYYASQYPWIRKLIAFRKRILFFN